MRIRIFNSLILFFLVCILYSCTKESNINNTPPNNIDTTHKDSIIKSIIDSPITLFISGHLGLYSYNAKSGKLNWTKKLSRSIFSSPFYSKGYIYVGCADSCLYAIDTSGSVIWKVSTGGSIGKNSPIVLNDVVYIQNSNFVLAYNALTGSPKWSFTTNFGAEPPGFSIVNNTLYTNYGTVYAIDINTGILKWSKYIDQYLMFPKVYNNKLYSAGNHTMTVWDATNGNFLWSKSFDISSGNELAINVKYGNIYLLRESSLTVMDTLNGNTIKWAKSFNSCSPYSLSAGSSPVIADSIILTNDINGNMSVENAITGEHIGGLAVNLLDNDMTLANGYFFCGGRDLYNQFQGHTYGIAIKSFTLGLGLVESWVSTERSDFSTTPCVITKSGKVYRSGDVFE